MLRTSITMPRGVFDQFKRYSIQRLERAAMKVTDRASRDAHAEIKAALGKGRGGAIKQFSDQQKGSVYRRGEEAFSASGGLAIRTRNERTVGAIKSATEGANIVPVKGRYLWIATDEIPKRAGRRKMTPALYRASGLEQRIGPLVPVRGINGRPLLVVRGASVSAAGASNRAKSRTKTGKLRKGQRAKDFIVAFVGVPRVTRRQEVNVPAIMKKHADAVGPAILKELER